MMDPTLGTVGAVSTTAGATRSPLTPHAAGSPTLEHGSPSVVTSDVLTHLVRMARAAAQS